MHINKKDVLWNYAATFLKLASSALLFPFILRMMPAETVGIWTVFITVTAFGNLLDFGFNGTFARNITYVFSGVRSLKTTGFEAVPQNAEMDYGLLKGVISAMRWFYFRMAAVLFLLLTTVGTWYILSLLKDYKGNLTEIYIAWGLLCFINSYNIFTLYYDSLLQGKGLIKKSKQIIIIGNLVYLIISVSLVMAGKGLVAIVSAQAASVVIIRWLSYKTFFTATVKQQLNAAIAVSKQEVLKAITPNAIKIGLTALGGFMVQRSAIIIGSLYLTLEEIASYGITMQLVAIIAGLSGIFNSTYYPKIAQLRVEQNNQAIKELYLKGQWVLFLTFIAGGTSLILLGEWALNFIGSQTPIMPRILVFLVLFITFLETNHSIAGSILLTRNEVPFFKASLIAGSITVMLLLLFMNFFHFGLLAMILAPGLAHLYNNWKWPYEVIRQLQIKKDDHLLIIYNLLQRKNI